MTLDRSVLGLQDSSNESIAKIIVPKEAEGLRADIFFAESLNVTRSAAQKILAANGIEKNRRVGTGETFSVEIPAPAPMEAIAEDIPLNIVYEDADLLVVDKPRGLVVHPAAGHAAGTLVNALLHHCELSGVGGAMRPGIVHRLDKDTSGLMVVAKNDAAHAALAAQLERRTMGRTYNAVCVGSVKTDALRIDLPIGRHPRDRKKMCVVACCVSDAPETGKSVLPLHSSLALYSRGGGGHSSPSRAREAVTNVKVLERFFGGGEGKLRGSRAGVQVVSCGRNLRGNFTLVEAKLETGRTHQIRVHMAHIGHPVLGDAVYGGGRACGSRVNSADGLGGQILHAVGLRFIHPTSGEEMVFASPWPEYFKACVPFGSGGQ